MRPLCNSRAVRLSSRRRRCSSFPDKIPTAETRRRRYQIGLAPPTGQARGRPSDHRFGHLALEDRKFRAVLSVVQNTTFQLAAK
jgi:hypothetical protein